ncbi:hypothetical protein GGI12_004587 [Dipsacomyces acuminosporus]|nr:hypothetical protein GGI12_004587 [Dipsacomyces acuminosporus]
MNSPNACIDNIHNGHALHTISDLADAKIDVDWRWGLPYPLNARAHDCVLQFPDDPLSRLLEAKHTDDWTVSMLLEMVALGEECGSGRRAAYFSVTLPFPSDDNGATANSSSASSDGKDNAEKPALSAEDYDKVLVALFDQDMDFSNTESARISTEKLFDFLDTSNFTRTTATATTKGQIITTAPKKHEAPAPRVNDLTMVIRKKRKTTKQ